MLAGQRGVPEVALVVEVRPERRLERLPVLLRVPVLVADAREPRSADAVLPVPELPVVIALSILPAEPPVVAPDPIELSDVPAEPPVAPPEPVLTGPPAAPVCPPVVPPTPPVCPPVVPLVPPVCPPVVPPMPPVCPPVAPPVPPVCATALVAMPSDATAIVIAAQRIRRPFEIIEKTQNEGGSEPAPDADCEITLTQRDSLCYSARSPIAFICCITWIKYKACGWLGSRRTPAEEHVMFEHDRNHAVTTVAAIETPWTKETAHAWYAELPWLVGCNFTPSYAVNQLEFWQHETFDPVAIDRELAWAAALGMNAVRVYLHDLLWQQDPEAFAARIDRYLAIADRHGIRTMLVLFDSCWDPNPALGPQRDPTPDVHNSGWVQSPGVPALSDPAQHGRLRDYVSGVVAAFANDRRVLAWDIWNEPDNGPEVSLCDRSVLAAKSALVTPLLIQAFGWARAALPMQPLTSAIWLGNWSADHRLSPIQRVQTANSDVISFHNYGTSKDFARRVRWLKSFGRPVLCTEYMARQTGSTFEAILPKAKKHRVAAFCWGLVLGRTQTHLGWDTTENHKIAGGFRPWFHDILHPDGRPHLPYEAEFLRRITRTAEHR